MTVENFPANSSAVREEEEPNWAKCPGFFSRLHFAIVWITQTRCDPEIIGNMSNLDLLETGSFNEVVQYVLRPKRENYEQMMRRMDFRLAKQAGRLVPFRQKKAAK